MIHKAIANAEIEITTMAGCEMLEDVVPKALGGVNLGEFANEIGLR